MIEERFSDPNLAIKASSALKQEFGLMGGKWVFADDCCTGEIRISADNAETAGWLKTGWDKVFRGHMAALDLPNSRAFPDGNSLMGQGVVVRIVISPTDEERGSQHLLGIFQSRCEAFAESNMRGKLLEPDDVEAVALLAATCSLK